MWSNQVDHVNPLAPFQSCINPAVIHPTVGQSECSLQSSVFTVAAQRVPCTLARCHGLVLGLKRKTHIFSLVSSLPLRMVLGYTLKKTVSEIGALQRVLRRYITVAQKINGRNGTESDMGNPYQPHTQVSVKRIFAQNLRQSNKLPECSPK